MTIIFLSVGITDLILNGSNYHDQYRILYGNKKMIAIYFIISFDILYIFLLIIIWKNE